MHTYLQQAVMMVGAVSAALTAEHVLYCLAIVAVSVALMIGIAMMGESK